MFRTGSLAMAGIALLVPAFVSAETKTFEQDANFAACRANLQALYMAHTGKLTRFTVNTAERLESTFVSKDGSTDITVTCIAADEKMITQETPRAAD